MVKNYTEEELIELGKVMKEFKSVEKSYHQSSVEEYIESVKHSIETQTAMPVIYEYGFKGSGVHSIKIYIDFSNQILIKELYVNKTVLKSKNIGNVIEFLRNTTYEDLLTKDIAF